MGEKHLEWRKYRRHFLFILLVCKACEHWSSLLYLAFQPECLAQDLMLSKYLLNKWQNWSLSQAPSIWKALHLHPHTGQRSWEAAGWGKAGLWPTDLRLMYKSMMQHPGGYLPTPTHFLSQHYRFSSLNITGSPLRDILTLGSSWVRMWEYGVEEGFLYEARELWEWGRWPRVLSEWRHCLPGALPVLVATATMGDTFLSCSPLSTVTDGICQTTFIK